jgi:hypothetical protein
MLILIKGFWINKKDGWFSFRGVGNELRESVIALLVFSNVDFEGGTWVCRGDFPANECPSEINLKIGRSGFRFSFLESMIVRHCGCLEPYDFKFPVKEKPYSIRKCHFSKSFEDL